MALLRVQPPELTSPLPAQAPGCTIVLTFSYTKEDDKAFEEEKQCRKPPRKQVMREQSKHCLREQKEEA